MEELIAETWALFHSLQRQAMDYRIWGIRGVCTDSTADGGTVKLIRIARLLKPKANISQAMGARFGDDEKQERLKSYANKVASGESIFGDDDNDIVIPTNVEQLAGLVA